MRAVKISIVVAVAAVLAAVGLEVAGVESVDRASAGNVTSATISAYPSPGTGTASPRTQISLRGAPADRLGEIEVRGSRTGEHSGDLRAHSDGEGASFVPDRPFAPGERVTVRTELRIRGARRGDFSITTYRPARNGGRANPRIRRLRPGEYHRFRSRPDLRPPVVTARGSRNGLAPGYVFLGPKKSAPQDGPLIVDDRGEPVWFQPLSRGLAAFDVKVQRYRDAPVITWWQGRLHKPGYGRGEYVLADSTYRQVKKVRAGNGYAGDLHDFQITPRDTAYVIAYQSIRTSIGNGRILDGVLQEIDLRTGLVLFEWHSLGNVAVRETYTSTRARPDDPYDYFHLNSVDELPDGNLLISGRNTHAVYILDKETGRVLRRIGGKRSSVRMGRGTRFAWQHDARRRPDGAITILDNAAAPQVGPQTRGIVLRVSRRRATLARAFTHPRRILSNDQANMQTLPDGNVVIGWGPQPVTTEFDRRGRVLLDLTTPRGVDTYRAYKFPWTGQSDRRPSIAATRSGGRVTVYASWNGATEVARWEVLAGESPEDLQPVGSRDRDGFETAVSAQTTAPFVAARALDASGRALGTSRAIRP